MLPCIIKGCGRLLAEGYLSSGGVLVLAESGFHIIKARLLEIGDRLRFTKPSDIGFTMVVEGETGTVEYVGNTLGEVFVVLDIPHKELAAYGNSITLLPLVTSELLDVLEVVE